MRVIAVEEHFVTPAFVEGPGKGFLDRFKNSGPRGALIADRLFEMGDKRVAEMDAAGIDMMVLSLNSPGVEQMEASDAVPCARDANDFLAAAIKRHPTRYAGFAALPIQAPDEAAKEFERCVKSLGFKGTNINGHTRGRYLDDPYFTPILACADALGVPIYLHRDDLFLYERAVESGRMFGLRVEPQPPIDEFYSAGQVLAFGEYEARPHHTPGHCPGGVCLQIGKKGERGTDLFVGDTLFAGSIGRTDLPGGDYNTLIGSIRTVLFAFGDEAIVHPGHGPTTTIGHERLTNPFLLAL